MKQLTLPMLTLLLFLGMTTLAADTPKPVADPAEAKVTEIGQRRTECYGTCPAYTVTIKSDGTFAYQGKMHVEHKGNWTGKLQKGEFEKLAHLVVAADFPNLKDKYTRTVTDNPTVFTTAVIDGKSKTVEDYAHAGPEALKDLETAISVAVDHAMWDEQKK